MKALKNKNEMLFFAFRNWKLQIGVLIILLFIFIALIGPSFAKLNHFNMLLHLARSTLSEFWLGTTFFGQDVFSQFVHGLRRPLRLVSSVEVLALYWVNHRFYRCYKGGVIDEILNALTNIVLVIPTMAVLLIIAAYLQVRTVFIDVSLSD
jgi:peptide/nickel transport system permease protein